LDGKAVQDLIHNTHNLGITAEQQTLESNLLVHKAPQIGRARRSPNSIRRPNPRAAWHLAGVATFVQERGVYDFWTTVTKGSELA
jgi:hypothetical protein